MRSPKSRWIVTTALATSTTFSGGRKPMTSASRGNVCHIAVAAAHAAPRRQVVAEQLAAAVADGNKAAAVGEDVNVVQRRDGKGDLELPRQIGLAIERIHKVLVRRVFEIERRPLNPDRMVGPRARQDRRRHLARVLLHLLAQPVRGRRRAGPSRCGCCPRTPPACPAGRH